MIPGKTELYWTQNQVKSTTAISDFKTAIHLNFVVFWGFLFWGVLKYGNENRL